MQALDPLGVYANQTVIDALSAKYGPRVLSFRYDRLDSNNNYIEPFVYMTDATVNYDMLATIKRTATFSMLDRSAINFGKDRIKPWVRLAMRDGGYVEWPQGVFLLSSPARKMPANGTTIARAVTAYDQLQALTDNKVLTRYTIPAGTVYTAAVGTLAAGFQVNITPSASTVPADLEYDPGTTYLAIMNDLLAAINYESVFFDENGVLVARPYLSPAVRPIEYDYETNQTSVITGEVDDGIDLFAIPNVWVYTVSEPDQSVLTSTYTNTNPLSPTSTVSRGRSIVAFDNTQSAPDQPTLDAIVARAAFEASQVYQTETFQTAMMPLHSNADVYNLGLTGLGISAPFGETSWSMPLKVGAPMTHSARRVVSV